MVRRHTSSYPALLHLVGRAQFQHKERRALLLGSSACSNILSMVLSIPGDLNGHANSVKFGPVYAQVFDVSGNDKCVSRLSACWDFDLASSGSTGQPAGAKVQQSYGRLLSFPMTPSQLLNGSWSYTLGCGLLQHR